MVTFETELTTDNMSELNRSGWRRLAYGFMNPANSHDVLTPQVKDFCSECSASIVRLINNPQLSLIELDPSLATISQISENEVKSDQSTANKE